MLRRLSSGATRATITTISSNVERKVTPYFFQSSELQSSTVQARHFHTDKGKTSKTPIDSSVTHQTTEEIDLINRNMQGVRFSAAVYKFLCVYNKCKVEPTYQDFLKQNGIDVLKFTDYTIVEGMIATDPAIDVFKLSDITRELLSKHGELIEKHEEKYEEYLKAQVNRLQTEAEALKDKNLTLAKLEEELNQLKAKWNTVNCGGRIFMSACVVSEAAGSRAVRVSGGNDYAPERQQERDHMAKIMRSMDVFMQGCVVVRASGSYGLQLPNEQISSQVQDLLKNEISELRSSSNNSIGQGRSIIDSTVYMYYINIIIERKIIFPIVAAACVTLLYGYFRLSNDDNGIDVNISKEIGRIDYLVPAPDKDYQESHWFNDLETKITEVETTTPKGYPIQIAISGLPGSGKTQLAKYYASMHAKEASLIWSIEADTPEKIWGAYLALAEKLGIDKTGKLPGENEQAWHERVCYKVNLALTKYPGWILILDNVKKFSEVRKYLPKTGQGKIIFTTRDNNLLDSVCHLNISNGLNPDEAVNFLHKFAELQVDESAYELARSLEYLPLYLRISSAVIKKSQYLAPEDRWTYKSYKEHVEKLSAADVEAEHKVHTKQIDYIGTQHAVIRSAIDDLSTDAQELIILCSYISASGITQVLLENFLKLQNDSLHSDKICQKCNELLDEITGLSLLQQASGESAYNIHRITQRIGRERKLSRQQADNMIKAVLLPFNKNADNLTTDDAIKKWKPLLPHLTNLANNTQIVHTADKERTIEIMGFTGYLYQILGDAIQSQYYFDTGIPLAEDYHGLNHVIVNIFLIASACNYGAFGQPQKQQELAMDALNRMKEFEKNPIVKTIYYSNILLTNIYGFLGSTERQKEAKQRVLEISEASFLEHNWRAMGLYNLAVGYIGLGDLEKAKGVLEVALDKRIKYYGEKHWQVAIVLDELASVYGSLGNPSHQKDFAERALAIKKVEFKDKPHWEVATTYNTLASAYGALGDHQQEKINAEKALAIKESYYGKNHWGLISALNNLANAYIALSMPQEALELCERALAIAVPYYGEKHWQVATILAYQANAHLALSNPILARNIFEQDVLPVLKNHYGKDSWHIAKHLSDLAQIYGALGEYAKKTNLITEALSILRANFGDSHPFTIRCTKLLN